MSGTGYTRGDFTADKAGEHVVIHAVSDGQGRLTLPDGRPLPNLRRGAPVQVRTLAASLNDKVQRADFSKLDERDLLPARTVLLAVVDLRCLDDRQLEDRLSDQGVRGAALEAKERAAALRSHIDGRLNSYDGLIEVELLQPQRMERKGIKSYRLQPCRCLARGLHRSGEPDYSLNHALTRISERLELTRISHTGNVFQRYLVQDPANPRSLLMRLGELRDRVEALPR